MNEPRRTPTRSCFGCRTRAPKSGLLRLMSGADGLLLGWSGDRRAQGRGRGRWVCPRRKCVDIASRKLLKSRATPERIPTLLADACARAEQDMRQRAAGLRRRRLNSAADEKLMALHAIIEGIDAQRA